MSGMKELTLAILRTSLKGYGNTELKEDYKTEGGREAQVATKHRWDSDERNVILPNCTTANCGKYPEIEPGLVNMAAYNWDISNGKNMTPNFSGTEEPKSLSDILSQLEISSIHNTSMASSLNDSSVAFTEGKNWAALGVLPIIAFVALGNILVIMAVSMDHKLRSSTNYFLTSLAVADLLVAITVMPPSLAMIVNNYVWPLDDRLCGIWVMLDVCFSTSSILHLCMISLDRYLALARPFKYNKGRWTSQNVGGWETDKSGQSRWRMGSGSSGGPSKMTKRVAKRILLVWAVALGIAVPLPILLAKDRTNLFVDDFCAINIPEFAIYGSLVAFFLPLVVMFVTYSLTIRTLQKQSKLVSHMMGSSTKRGLSTSSSTSSRTSGKRNSEKSYAEYAHTPPPRKKKTNNNSYYRRMPDEGKIEEERMLTMPDEKKVTISKSSSVGSSVLLSYDNSNKRSRIKHCALLCCARLRCSDYHSSNDNASRQDTDSAILSGNQATASKMDSESSDSSIEQPVKRSPLLTRANLKLAKAVSRLPLKRASTRGMSVSMKSRAIASEKRASKVLGMVFTMFCIFWCPFFVTNVLSRLCESCDQALMGELMNWFVWVGYVSSGVNPCLYTLFSRRFRDTFRKLLLRQYGRIGRKSFHRAYHDEERGKRSSVRYHTAFQNSLESSASLNFGSENRASFRPVGGATQRKLGETVLIRQHRRSQYTRRVPENEALMGDKSEKHLEDSVHNNLDNFQREMESERRTQWRTTWPVTSESENMTLNEIDVKLSIVNNGKLERKSIRPQRITSDPTSSGRSHSGFRQSTCHDRRLTNKDSNIRNNQEKQTVITGINPESKPEQVSSEHNADKFSLAREIANAGDEDNSTQDPTRCNQSQISRSSEKRLSCCSEVSLYDNDNPEEVFVESKKESSPNASANFTRSRSPRSESAEFSPPKKQDCFLSEGHTQFCFHCAAQYDKYDLESFFPLGRIAERTTQILNGNEYGMKTTELKSETNASARNELSRIDSGIGDSLRNSESY